MEEERVPRMDGVALVVRDRDARAGTGPDATASERRRTRTRRGRCPRAWVRASAPTTPEATRAAGARREVRRSPAGTARLRLSVDPDASRGGVDAPGSGAVGRHDRPRLQGFAGADARRPAPVAAAVRGRTRASRFRGADRANRTRRAARKGDRPRTPGGVPSPRRARLHAGAASVNERPRRPFLPPAVVKKQRIPMAVYTAGISGVLRSRWAQYRASPVFRSCLLYTSPSPQDS